jgi:hypothetical protein
MSSSPASFAFLILAPVRIMPLASRHKQHGSIYVSKGTRYGVACVALTYGEQWCKPYDKATLDALISQVCGPAIPFRYLSQDATLKAALKAAQKNREAVIMACDGETLNDPQYRGVIKAINISGVRGAAFLLIGPEGGRSTTAYRTAAETTLMGHFPQALPLSSIVDVESIRSDKSLSAALAITMAKLRARLLAEDPAAAARSPTLSAQAERSGIAIEKQPLLSGPGAQ